MDPFSEQSLNKIFYQRKDDPECIGSRESAILEFKRSFVFGELEKYAKTMAAFANNSGGYIVFGIENNPRKILGVDVSKFESISVEKLTEGLNDIFSPEIEWNLHTHSWMGKSFGLLYTYESKEKPIIATKVYGDINESDIYYRYRGRSEKIKYHSLVKIFENRLDQEKQAWQEVFKRTAISGPQNVAIMDIMKGKIEGLGKTVLIDNELLPKLKFIKRGEFNETKGAPTLKLIGELKTVPIAALKEKRVLIGEDIYKYRAADVSEEVSKQIKKEFRFGSEHLKAWRIHKIRYSGKPKTLPHKNEYCEYKEAERDYRYSKAWIEFLIAEYSIPNNYEKLIKTHV